MTKPYKKLDFTDNFMFSNTLYNNHELCRELLELILNIRIKKIVEVDPEKSIKTGNNSKGVRFDVYVEDENNTCYDIDMQIEHDENLPKRSRYYQRMLDAHQLKRGAKYKELKESYVIFICKYKLDIENDLPVYYYEYTCRDDCKLKLGDGSHIVFVNCNYKGDNISEELRRFFNYIKTGLTEGEDDNFTNRLAQEIKINRLNEEWEAAYMTFEEIVDIRCEKAKEEGIEQGRGAVIKRLLETLEPEKVAELLKISIEEVEEVMQKV